MGKNNASMYDLNTIISAGIDPKTGLPIRMADSTKCGLKDNIRKQLRVMDEQNAINRYSWYNLPKGLNGKLMERILYYKGQGMLFTLQGKFYFLPYALSAPEGSTGIDVYGRFTGVTPLPFNGTSNDGGGKDAPWIRGLIYQPAYEAADLADFADASPEEIVAAIEKSCVLLHDYTPQISQTNIPRQTLQDPLLDVMADCIPFMRTALLNGTGVLGLRVGNENEQAEVERLSNAINLCALNGKKYAAITGDLDFQELTGGNVAKAEEFMLALQSLDNYRLSLYGLDNGGLFQKKSHMLAAEQEMNAGNTGLVAEDGLRNRQDFCVIANSIFGTNMWCEPSETTLGIDRDGDMVAGSDGEAATATKAAMNDDGGNEE
jgi:hypothetical protein